MADSIRRVLDPDRRIELSAWGRKRANDFKWKTTAEQTLAVLLRAARG